MRPKNNFFASVVVSHQLLSGFLAKDHLPRVSRRSRLSANDKADNEENPVAVLRCPGI